MGRDCVVVLHRVAPRQRRLGRFLERNVVNCVVTKGVEVQERVVKGIEWIGWPIRSGSERWLPNRWHRRTAAVA